MLVEEQEKKKGKKEKSRGRRIDFKKGRGGDGNRGDEKRCFSEFRILRRVGSAEKATLQTLVKFNEI